MCYGGTVHLAVCPRFLEKRECGARVVKFVVSHVFRRYCTFRLAEINNHNKKKTPRITIKQSTSLYTCQTHTTITHLHTPHTHTQILWQIYDIKCIFICRAIYIRMRVSSAYSPRPPPGRPPTSTHRKEKNYLPSFLTRSFYYKVWKPFLICFPPHTSTAYRVARPVSVHSDFFF